MSRIEDALRVALKAHEGQERKASGLPFFVHLVDVMRFLMYDNADEDMVIAGILHDTLEDTHLPKEEIKKQFGDRVLKLVEFCTEPGLTPELQAEERRLSWKERKQAIVDACRTANDDELMLELADKLSNLASLRDDLAIQGEKMWDHFFAAKEEHKWYFSTLGDIFKERLGHTHMWHIYSAIFEKVFGEKK